MYEVVLRKVVFTPQHFNETNCRYQVILLLTPQFLNCYKEFPPMLHDVLPFISPISSCRDVGSYTIPYFLSSVECSVSVDLIQLYTVHQLGVMYVRGLKIQISIKFNSTFIRCENFASFSLFILLREVIL